MINASEEKSLIRSYLLRDLSEGELERVEERLFTDDVFFNLMLAEEGLMIDDYVSKRMSYRARKRFERSYLSTPEGREQVDLTKRMLEYTSPRQMESGPAIKSSLGAFFAAGFSSRFVRIVASLIIIFGTSGVVWRVFFYESALDAGMKALNQTYRQRPIEARVTGMNYARVASTRGGRDDVDNLARERAENLLLKEVSANPGKESHHLLGRFYLMDRDFDKAIEQLQAALTGSKGDAKIHNDLGAAFMEKGKVERDSGATDGQQLFLESLKHLSRAIELNNSLAEASFNRGLLYREMGEPDRAVADWNNYLNLDRTSDWANEARRNIEELKK